MKKRDYSYRQLVRMFLTIHLPKHRCYSKHTIDSYSDALDLFSRFQLKAKGTRLIDISFDMVTHDCVHAFISMAKVTRSVAFLR